MHKLQEFYIWSKKWKRNRKTLRHSEKWEIKLRNTTKFITQAPATSHNSQAPERWKTSSVQLQHPYNAHGSWKSNYWDGSNKNWDKLLDKRGQMKPREFLLTYPLWETPLFHPSRYQMRLKKKSSTWFFCWAELRNSRTAMKIPCLSWCKLTTPQSYSPYI